MESDIAPGLLSFEDDDGTIKFSITQLLKLPNKYMLDKLRGVKTTYRGIAAKSWMYEIKTKTDDKKNDVTLSIQSYWSGKHFETHTFYQRFSISDSGRNEHYNQYHY